MKLSLSTSVCTLTLAAVLAAGCTTTSSSGGGSGGGSFRVPTEHLSAAYATAAADQAALVAAIVTEVKAGSYKDAAATLQKLAGIPGLTATQEAAVKELAAALAGK